jgi:hypothetical protein
MAKKLIVPESVLVHENISKDCTEHWSVEFESHMQIELQHFEFLLPNLLLTDSGKFVAISEGKVVGTDADEFALAKKMSIEQGDKFVLIQQVKMGAR